MRGPFTEQQVSDMVGLLWLPARRFVIQQGYNANGPIYLAIDDYSEYGHNDAAAIREKIHTDGTDVNANHIKSWARAVNIRDRSVRIELSSGEILEGTLHEEWTEENLALNGFLADLKHAYRLVPRPASQRCLAFVAYWNSEFDEVEFGEHLGQPFGASAAVLNFNRLGRAIFSILQGSLYFVLSEYFDDYTVNEPEGVVHHGRKALVQALDFLGFPCECKQMPSPSYVSLGVKFDLEKVMSEGTLTIANSSQRVADLMSELDDIEKEGVLLPACSGKLRSRLGFSSAQYFVVVLDAWDCVFMRCGNTNARDRFPLLLQSCSFKIGGEPS